MNIIDVNLRFNNLNRWNNTPRALVVHHIEADNATVEDINSWHRDGNNWAGIGYHYYIRKDGSIYKGRPDDARGAHVAEFNYDSLGISFEGNYDKNIEMPQAQFNAWCELNQYLFDKYGKMPIYAHRDVGNSACPGTYFPIERIKNTNVNYIQQNVVGWKSDNTGWWYVYDNNKNYYVNKWSLIDGDWYYFNEKGYAKQSEWLYNKGVWYYLKNNCKMAKSEWVNVDDTFYCFDNEGCMYSNCITPDGYNVDSSGAWIR